MSSDPCDTEAAWRPWNLCVTVEPPACYGYQRRDLKTPGLTVVWESFATPCRLRGLTTPGSLVLAVPLWVGPRSRYWGRPVSSDRLLAVRFSGVDWIVDNGQSHLLLVVSGALVRRHLDIDLQAALERTSGGCSLPMKPNAGEALATRLVALIAEGNWVPDNRPPGAGASLGKELLRQLAEAVDRRRLVHAERESPRWRTGIERALEYLEVASLPAVKVSELAEVAGVSPRTLEHGFRDLFDLTPVGFLHLLRLHAVRRELSDGDGAGRTVREVADHWGFQQHGRFSGYYRKAFGELPSETRQRVAKPVKGKGAVSPADRQETRAKTSRARAA